MPEKVPYSRDALKVFVKSRRIIYDHTLKVHQRKELVKAAFVEIADIFIEDWANAQFCQDEWEKVKVNRERKIRRHKEKYKSGAPGGHQPFVDDMGWLSEVGRDMTAVRVSSLVVPASSMRVNEADDGQNGCCEAVRQAIERRDEELQLRPAPAPVLSPVAHQNIRRLGAPVAHSSPVRAQGLPETALDLSINGADPGLDELSSSVQHQSQQNPPAIEPVVLVMGQCGRSKRNRREPDKFSPSPLVKRTARRRLDSSKCMSDVSMLSSASVASATSARSTASGRKDRRKRRRATQFQVVSTDRNGLTTIHEMDTITRYDGSNEGSQDGADGGGDVEQVTRNPADGGGDGEQVTRNPGHRGGEEHGIFSDLDRSNLFGDLGWEDHVDKDGGDDGRDGQGQEPPALNEGVPNVPAQGQPRHARPPRQPAHQVQQAQQVQPAQQVQQVQPAQQVQRAQPAPPPRARPRGGRGGQQNVREARIERANAHQDRQRAFHNAHEANRLGIRANLQVQAQARRAELGQQEAARAAPRGGPEQESAEVILLRQFLTERTRDGVDYYGLSLAQQLKQLPPAVITKFMSNSFDLLSNLLRASEEELEDFLNSAE